MQFTGEKIKAQLSICKSTAALVAYFLLGVWKIKSLLTQAI